MSQATTPLIADEGGGHLDRSVGLVGLTFVSVASVIGSGWLFGPKTLRPWQAPPC